MQRFLQQKDSVSLCYKDSCIHAKGSNANLIAVGAFVMLVLIGLASISTRN
jgi:hypothetical protein